MTNTMAVEGDEKETVFFVDESLKVLCTGDATPGRKDRSPIIVGTNCDLTCIKVSCILLS